MTVHVPVLNTLTTAERLNESCFCITSDSAQLRGEITAACNGGAAEGSGWPHLLSEVPVFVPKAAFAAMLQTVGAIEAAANLPAFRAEALRRAPAIAQADHGPVGALMGYDFHLDGEVPRLIEINTNAGGASINALLLAAQRACCSEVERQIETAAPDFDAAVAAMFLSEWRRQRGEGQPGRIAIVDDRPADQYLYPEFALFQRTLQTAGIETVIADAAELRFDGGRLTHDGKPIDLVYNRLVDFMLEDDAHAALRAAYEAGAAVVTPNPHVYAKLADKRNLVLLSDAQFLEAAGLGPDHRAALAAIPRTIAVTAGNADALWSGRAGWFFKPVSGHGGKAVYRGDKLTRSVWSRIVEGGYVAQTLAAPGRRMVRIDGVATERKTDIRLYTYGGKLLLAAARLYQGQTTNFRTPGGGFAPVYVV
ncbi:MAG: hypothetical protein HY834_15295 [Devosia nanyangense]|uniref:Circularly permuted type 2 ATP-grasp protein n=1 Tax=Devosia nanyangense TaxID=1228055 RepID=A0A933NZU2_9HYPH|nr:hypothetical protein [Devosia nanyangense]